MPAGRFFAIASTVVALSALTLGTAQADTGGVVQGNVRVESAEGDAVGGWMSQEYINAHPDDAAAMGIVAHPNSASKCDADTCLDVVGTGLRVTQMNASGFGNVGCTAPHYHRNWGFLYTEYNICPDGDGPGVYWYSYKRPRTFNDGDVVSVHWDNIDGEPAARIHR